MKMFLINAVTAAMLQPMAKILFDDVETKTFTQEQIDASFKAGQKKAAADAAASAQTAELADLKKFKEDREAADKLSALTSSFETDEVKALGIRAGGNAAFGEKFKDRLLGKKGNELSAEIKAIKADKANAFYFDAEDAPNAGNSLIDAAKSGGKKSPKKVEYYPGSSIQKN